MTDQGPASIADAVQVVRDLLPQWTQYVLNQNIRLAFNPQAALHSEEMPRPKPDDFDDFFTARYPDTDVSTVVYRILRTIYNEVGQFFKFARPDATINSFHRFFLIYLQCGPDRALTSFEDQDDLWETGMPDDADLETQMIVLNPPNPDMDNILVQIRDLFYGTLKTHGEFDPRPQDPANPRRTNGRNLKQERTQFKQPPL